MKIMNGTKGKKMGGDGDEERREASAVCTLLLEFRSLNLILYL